MGLFNNYEKPGPGVRKDAPKQKAVPRFFSVFKRHFFDLCKVNLLFCIPVAIVTALVILLNRIYPYLAVDFIPIIFLFPFLAGLTFVTRNYAREEHTFILSDFKDAVKNNWSAFLLDGILCYVVTIMICIAVPFYWKSGGNNILSAVASGLCIAIGLFFIYSQYYVPVMIVTFNLKLSQILRNSFIFAILGFGRNFLVTLLLAIVAFLCYLTFLTPSILTIIMPLFTIFLMFSYCSFLINFAAYPLVDKYMVQPYKAEQKKKNQLQEKEDGEDDDDIDFKDNL
jgi:uncharacterized membrane protein YesL